MLHIRALAYQIYLIVTVIPYAIACLIWAPLPLKLRYRLTVGWPWLALWGARYILGIRWQVKGWENLPDGPAILLSKHQSAWETLFFPAMRSEEHTSELQSRFDLVCRLLLEKKKNGSPSHTCLQWLQPLSYVTWEDPP